MCVAERGEKMLRLPRKANDPQSGRQGAQLEAVGETDKVKRRYDSPLLTKILARGAQPGGDNLWYSQAAS